LPGTKRRCYELASIPEGRSVSKALFPAYAAMLRLSGAVLFLSCSVAATHAQTPQPQPATAAPSPVGEWLVAKKVARIRIANCENRMWGVVSWEAQAGVDSKNPDPKLRERPTLGMPIILGMKPNAAGNKWEGEIYSAENGKTYSANISLKDENTLAVQGCVLSVLCGGENWTRFENPEAQPAPAPAKQPKQPAKKRGDEKARAAEPLSENDKVCASVAGTTGSAHEGRLEQHRSR
jgi:uncharacterized protein (DUF2147 family)